MSWRDEQEQFWEWITRPRDLRADSKQIDRLFAPPARIERTDALAIYNNAFHQRLIQIASEMYPVLYHTLGPEVFAQLWLGYLSQHLPKPGPMSRMTEMLLAFVRGHPQFGTLPALLDIIQVETLMLELFDRADVPALSREQLLILPEQEWPAARWQPRGDWAVVNSNFDLAGYWRRMQIHISSGASAGSADFGVEPGAPRAFLVQRRNFRMHLQPLAPAFAQFLFLLQDDLDFAAICTRLAECHPDEDIPALSLKLLLEAISLELIGAGTTAGMGASCLVRAER